MAELSRLDDLSSVTLANCESLQESEVRCIDWWFADKLTPSPQFCALIAGLRGRLACLVISGSWRLADDAIACIAEHVASGLHELGLASLPDTSDDAYALLLSKCTQLR